MSLAGSAKPTVEAIHPDLEHLSYDTKLVEKIMRKRTDEMERRTKLLNPRSRKFGAEPADLDAQVAEKKAARAVEMREEAYHAECAKVQEQVLHKLEGVKQVVTRHRQKDAMEYSLANLRKEQRREYSLSDPHALKYDLPADQTATGPSAFQILSGDDQDYRGTKAAEKARQAEWLQAQVAEKLAKKDAELELDQWHDQQMLNSNQIRAACEQQEMEERKLDKLDEAAENRELAAVHRARREAQQKKDEDARNAHVEGVRSNDRMIEADDFKLGLDGRVLRTEYKRMPLCQKQDIHDTNAQLVAEKQAKRNAEYADEMEHAKSVSLGVSVLGALEAERHRQKKERTKAMLEQNLQMAQAKKHLALKERQEYLAFEHTG